LYRTFWVVISGSAVIGACVFRRGRVTGRHDAADAELLHEAMRGSGSDSDDDCDVVANQAVLGRAPRLASLSQREEQLQQRFWTEGGRHPYDEVVSTLRELRYSSYRSRSDAWVDPIEAFESSMRASVWQGRWYSHPLFAYIAMGVATGVLVFFADNFDYIFAIRPRPTQTRDVVFAVCSAIGLVASYTAGMLLTFRSTFEPVRFVRHANKAVSDILERAVDEQRKLSDVIPLRSSFATVQPSVVRVSPPASTFDPTARTSAVKHIDATPFMSSLRSLPVQRSAGVGDSTQSAGAAPSVFVADVDSLSGSSSGRTMIGGTGAAGGSEAVVGGVVVVVGGGGGDTVGSAAKHAADEHGGDSVAEAVVSLARRNRRIQRLDLADWYLLRENVQWRTRELMARSSVGLFVILLLGVSQIIRLVNVFIWTKCPASIDLFHTNCGDIIGHVSNIAAYWVWLAVAMLVVALASMKQARDAHNMGVLAHLVDIANDSVVTDSRGHYSVAELKALLASRAKNLLEYDRFPSIFDSVQVSPKVMYAATTLFAAPFVTFTFRQFQSVFSRSRSGV
jgi:hypothetical protein